MVGVAQKMCEHLEHSGCIKQPYFNVPDSETGRFCSKHDEEGMVDIKHKTCEQPGCMKHPYFNVLVSKAGRFCS